MSTSWMYGSPSQVEGYTWDSGSQSYVPTGQFYDTGAGGGTPGPSSAGDTVTTSDGVDYAAESQAMFPWLTGQLLSTYADLWAESGSATAALAKLRDTSPYKSVFKGIRREDGTLRMDENAYMSQMYGFREIMSEFEVATGGSEFDLSRLIELEVDAREFASVIAEAVTRFREPGAAEDNGLVSQFVSGFMQSGSLSAALEQVRQTSEYEQVFAGNRRDDGTIRMDENAYFSYKRGWERIFLSRGLNPEPFEAQGRLAEAVRNEVSIQELEGRVQAVETNVLGNTASVRQFFVGAYGQEGAAFLQSAQDEGFGRSTALAMALDPTVGNELLSRRITAAQIGGEAAVQGFARSVQRAEELARAGVSQAQARNLYSQAGLQLGGLSAATRRFRRGDTNLADFESAFALGEAGQQQRITRALQDEGSSFSSTRDVMRSGDGFGLAGLRQQ